MDSLLEHVLKPTVDYMRFLDSELVEITYTDKSVGHIIFRHGSWRAINIELCRQYLKQLEQG